MRSRRRLAQKQPMKADAARDYLFAAGQEAVLLYKHKGRTYQIPVTVVMAVWESDHSFTSKKPTKPRADISYVVKSSLGGTMTVSGALLRPGGTLDRIAIALEFDDVAPDLD